MNFKTYTLLFLFICLHLIGFTQETPNSIEDFPDLIVDENTYIEVCFWADHTFVSDLGFYLKAPGCQNTWPGLSGVVELLPCISDWNSDTGFNSTGIPFSALGCGDPSQIGYVNSGNNIEEFCFSTHSSLDGSIMVSGNSEYTACVADLPTPLSGTYASVGSWDKIYGYNALTSGWSVQIYDSEQSDVGALTRVTITFFEESDCGENFIFYDLHNIYSNIADNETNPNNASCYFVTLSNESYYNSYVPDVQICKVEAYNTNYNEIVWEDPITESIDYYNIYRTDEFGEYDSQYTLIDSVGYDAENYYIDSMSYPDIESYYYKISTKDICGYNSNKSDFHKTFFLQSILMPDDIWKLSWDLYEGAQYSEIEILRGTSPDEMEVVETVSATETSYIITNASEELYWYYRLRAVLPYSCNPTKNQDYVRSNIVEVENLNVNVSEVGNQEGLIIFPNPTARYFELKSKDKVGKVLIYDNKGRLVLRFADVEKNVYDISSLSSGEYVVEVESSGINKYRKLIVY